jgi:hypothetical protein
MHPGQIPALVRNEDSISTLGTCSTLSHVLSTLKAFKSGSGESHYERISPLKTNLDSCRQNRWADSQLQSCVTSQLLVMFLMV